jgi:hypothetical protein
LIGRKLVIKTKNGFNSQIFYFDQVTRTIKSHANKGWSWDIQNAGRTNNLQMWSTNSGWFQLFRYSGYNWVNVKNHKVLDVSGGKDSEGQRVQVWKRHNGANQRWTIVYLDQSPKEPTTGLNKDFGFWVNRPFVIISRLPMGRAVEIVGGRHIVIKHKVFGKKSQQFYFDGKSKTVKSV